MNYIIFIILALIEHVIVAIISREIIHLQYEYISIKYATFKFSDTGEKYCGLNILIKIFFPAIYMTIISGILYEINMQVLINHIYLISVFYYIIRWICLIFILNRKELNDWKSDIKYSVLGIILNIFIYNTFITKTNEIFISVEELKNGIWFGIITFFFVIIRNYIYEYSRVNQKESSERRENYVLKKYYLYKKRYGYLIDEKNKEIEAIIYGIMIYEDYNRPAFFRFFEYIKYFLTGNASLGIMQVESNVMLSNITSIRKGCEIVREAYNKYNTDEYSDDERLRNIISTYNLGDNYADEVMYIITIVKEEMGIF